MATILAQVVFLYGDDEIAVRADDRASDGRNGVAGHILRRIGLATVQRHLIGTSRWMADHIVPGTYQKSSAVLGGHDVERTVRLRAFRSVRPFVLKGSVEFVPDRIVPFEGKACPTRILEELITGADRGVRIDQDACVEDAVRRFGLHGAQKRGEVHTVRAIGRKVDRDGSEAPIGRLGYGHRSPVPITREE